MSFIGTYNDMANSGLKGRVSVWVECYDLAGNSVDGGGPGFEYDYVTYVSMDLEYPTIKSLNIENSFGERMLQSIPVMLLMEWVYGIRQCLPVMNTV